MLDSLPHAMTFFFFFQNYTVHLQRRDCKIRFFFLVLKWSHTTLLCSSCVQLIKQIVLWIMHLASSYDITAASGALVLLLRAENTFFPTVLLFPPPTLPASFHHQHLIQSVSTDLPRNVEYHQCNKVKHSSGFDKLIRWSIYCVTHDCLDPSVNIHMITFLNM